MEINNHFKPVLITPTAGADATAASKILPRSKQASARQAEALPLEQMQQALRAMPDVDLEKVAKLKQALQRGELATDPAALASSMLAYHRGSDV